jgi:hypothetical protein
VLKKDVQLSILDIEHNDILYVSSNEHVELDISSDDLNKQFVCRIQESEIKYALKRMKGGKAMGPDVIPIEV